MRARRDPREEVVSAQQALGDRIKFRGINYSVVGVLESKGQSLGGDQDTFVAIPITHRD